MACGLCRPQLPFIRGYIRAKPNSNQSTCSVAASSFNDVNCVEIEMTKQGDLGLDLSHVSANAESSSINSSVNVKLPIKITQRRVLNVLRNNAANVVSSPSGPLDIFPVRRLVKMSSHYTARDPL